MYVLSGDWNKVDRIVVCTFVEARSRPSLVSAPPTQGCLVKTLLDDQEKEMLDWEDLCMLSTVFTLGGVHSTSGIIEWFLALIPSRREVLARAQTELDEVIGRNRWPTFEDEESLPFIRAIIKEFATPHCASEDFAHQEMYILKGSVVLLNCYILHHNKARYPDSFKFNPERYKDDKISCTVSAKLPNVMDRDHWAFGAG
ncbi:hypothetical protein CVT25_015671 [Psilocybe cyanescens]|uniref:Cytochrome P450 n=1 Tax=Psilocybe cyanescens TaxID=93625 RepID=A0A409WSH3_PSICY|nr:hypothetical protein CVT25_015671 [Psilocybe cyanescens]